MGLAGKKATLTEVDPDELIGVTEFARVRRLHRRRPRRTLTDANYSGSSIDAAGVDSAEEFSEGDRSAAPLLGHMIRGDNTA